EDEPSVRFVIRIITFSRAMTAAPFRPAIAYSVHVGNALPGSDGLSGGALAKSDVPPARGSTSETPPLATSPSATHEEDRKKIAASRLTTAMLRKEPGKPRLGTSR